MDTTGASSIPEKFQGGQTHPWDLQVWQKAQHCLSSFYLFLLIDNEGELFWKAFNEPSAFLRRSRYI